MSFTYKNDRLHCEGVDLKDIADLYGTPAYIYSESILKRNAEVIKTCFIDHGFKVSYAIKANPNPALLKLFKSYGLGLDIVSGGELQMATHAGFTGAEINFAGVGKTDAELEMALKTGIAHFNVESQYELEHLNKKAAELDVKASVLLRLNPDIDPQTHPHISTGLKGNKFGMGPELVRKFMISPQVYPHLKIEGIHCHIGSQILKPQPFYDLIDYLEQFTQSLEADGVELTHIDLGGGFGVNYEDPFEDILETTPYLETFAQKALDKLGKYQLHIQPGRVLVANSAILLAQVLGTKVNGDHHFTIVDASTTELIRPALYDAYHAVYPYKDTDQTQFGDIVGPVCESSDALAKKRKHPAVVEGDYLAVASAGAYASSMASNYNLRPLSPEIMVGSNQKLYIIRRRQDFEEMIQLY